MSTERKTKMSSLATFLIVSALLAWISTESSDLIKALPDWIEVPAGGAAVALGTWLAGYLSKHRPESLSESAVEAFRARLGKRAGYNSPDATA